MRDAEDVAIKMINRFGPQVDEEPLFAAMIGDLANAVRSESKRSAKRSGMLEAAKLCREQKSGFKAEYYAGFDDAVNACATSIEAKAKEVEGNG